MAGIAVTAAIPPYPNLCFTACYLGFPANVPHTTRNIGLAWITRPDVRVLAPSTGPLSYVLNLKLDDPAAAQAFVNARGGGNNPDAAAPTLIPWPSIKAVAGLAAIPARIAARRPAAVILQSELA